MLRIRGGGLFSGGGGGVIFGGRAYYRDFTVLHLCSSPHRTLTSSLLSWSPCVIADRL